MVLGVIRTRISELSGLPPVSPQAQGTSEMSPSDPKRIPSARERGWHHHPTSVSPTTTHLPPLHTHTHRHPGQSCRETKGRGLGGAGCGGGARPARSMRRETRSLRAPAKGAGVRTLAAARTLSNINKGTPPSPWCSGLEEDCGWAEVCEGGCGIWLCPVSGSHASCVLPIVERVGSTL